MTNALHFSCSHPHHTVGSAKTPYRAYSHGRSHQLIRRFRGDSFPD